MPLPDDFDDRLAALHAKGATRNEIARALGCGVATVTRHAKALGLSFDRSATAAAVAAKQVDARARRQQLIADLYDIADQDVALLKAPTYSYRVVYKDDTEVVTDAHAPSGDRRNHVSAIQNAISTAVKLEQVDAGNNVSTAFSLLDSLANGFAAAAAGYTPSDA